MTPRVVVFTLSDETTVGEFIKQYEASPFSRIPLYHGNPDHVTGFALRDDLLLAAARDQDDVKLSEFSRPLDAVPESLRLTLAFDRMVSDRNHIAIVVDEYGGLAGLVTLEDIVETLLGLEIVDEADTTADMREFARSQWEQRAKKMGLSIDGRTLSDTAEGGPESSDAD
jgi:CBS domain containing-hemolysin-like protein